MPNFGSFMYFLEQSNTWRSINTKKRDQDLVSRQDGVSIEFHSTKFAYLSLVKLRVADFIYEKIVTQKMMC